ncbi:ankyrin repeat domain-containing protein 16 [Elysia marginata]|uniref:Ankyrin repeat domain-containing protein 16 n=1 Tax=Elysia marginata TaxID=1093978 RepID=A0AAV4EV15_9GAST|nr:ankyrin repeat domain-containing protein 16 [Elysia marginata]
MPFSMDFQTAQHCVNNNNVAFFKAFSNPEHLLHLRHKKSGDTLLHLCCRCGSETVLIYFLEDLKANLEVSNNDGKRPLHDAAQYSQEGCLSILLNHGAEPNVFKRSDWTPLMLACTKQSLNAVDLLLRAGADPGIKNKDGWNSFHLASRVGNTDILSRLIAAHPEVWDTRSKNLRTPLHTAALHGRCEAISLLLSECGYEPDCVDSCGVTPFMDALRGGHVDIAKVLLKTGKVMVEREDKAGRQAIHQAAQSGQKCAVDFLVQELGVLSTVSSSRSGETPLHAAVKDGQTEMVVHLLNMGADPDAVDCHRRTALDVARACRKDACATAILQWVVK